MESRKFLFLAFIILGLSSFLTFSAQQDTNYYRIKFTDKTNTPFDIQQPEGFLTSKAVARRDKYSISITTNDLPVDPNYISQVLSYSSVSYITHSKWFNQLVVISNDTNDINLIKQLPFVASSEKVRAPIKTSSSDKKLMIAETKSSILVNPHYPYGKTFDQIHLHGAEYMHDLGFNGQGMDIAIIDAGFENVRTLNGLSHLFETGQILSTYDFVDRELSVNEDHYHGSAVLSVIAGNIPGEFHGTAVSANFHLLRSEDADAEYIIEEDYWVRAAEYADSAGCDIISTSLGYTTFDDSTQNHTYADMDGNTTLIAKANDIASSKGILCVSSAGNLGGSEWGYISTPADADSCLTIGAINIFDELAPFSSFGPSADGDIKPNLVSVGYLTELIAPWDNEIIQGNGTSFSCPMTSGLAACLWQALPDLSNMEIKTLLENTASQSNTPDTLRGYGYPKIFEAYSSVTGITYQDPEHLKIQSIYPNPASKNEAISILVAADEDSDIELLLIDVTGRIITRQTTSLVKGLNMLSIPEGLSFSAGIYTVVIQNDNQISKTRFTID